MNSDLCNYENLSPGSIVFNRYKILRYLGRGGTSVVYACAHTDNQEMVAALKVLSDNAAKDEKIVARFRSEIRVASRLDHPHVVQVIEFVRNTYSEAYSMELVEGGSLHDLLCHQERPQISEIVRLLQQICKGVQAIHKAGIVHRDLKPKNILLTLKRDVKISDFSTAICPDAGRLPYDEGAVGTYEYMSPEVLTKGKADLRSDVFAVGVIAYQMLTGELPFQTRKFADKIAPTRQGRLKAPSLIRSDCPSSLAQLVMKALQVKPTKRFQTAEEMDDALANLRLDERPLRKRLRLPWSRLA